MSELEEWAGQRGRSWAERVEGLERQLSEPGRLTMAALAPAPGERVLEIGCGAGALAVETARAVGPDGLVVGVDVSADLLTAARTRPGGERPRFVEADAARVGLGELVADGRPFDALFSRFGCMFFEDPPAAFANLAACLEPGGRVVLCIWAELAANPWARIPTTLAEEVLGPAEPQPAGTAGPFAWADPATYHRVLEGAGVAIEEEREEDVELTIGEGDAPDPIERAIALMVEVGPVTRRLKGRGPVEIEAVRERLRDGLAPHVRDGWVRLGGRVRLIRGRRRAPHR